MEDYNNKLVYISLEDYKMYKSFSYCIYNKNIQYLKYNPLFVDKVNIEYHKKMIEISNYRMYKAEKTRNYEAQ